MNIIGYIHVCQKGDWRRSFKMLIDSIKQSQLYSYVNIIRIGIVNESVGIINDPLLVDNKFEVIYLGNSSQYERPTLLHMRTHAERDPVDTVYFYLHTKGIRHFGTPKEANVISWIILMLYWNISRWRYASEILKKYNTYGCEFIKDHFSGNFWWATAKHIQRLPKKIDSFYIAPEKWVTIVRDKLYCAYRSDYAGGGLYSHYLSPQIYTKLTNNEAYNTNFKPCWIEPSKHALSQMNTVNHSSRENITSSSIRENITSITRANVPNISRAIVLKKDGTLSRSNVINRSTTLSRMNVLRIVK